MERVKVFSGAFEGNELENSINHWLVETGEGIEITRVVMGLGPHLRVTTLIFYKSVG